MLKHIVIVLIAFCKLAEMSTKSLGCVHDSIIMWINLFDNVSSILLFVISFLSVGCEKNEKKKILYCWLFQIFQMLQLENNKYLIQIVYLSYSHNSTFDIWLFIWIWHLSSSLVKSTWWKDFMKNRVESAKWIGEFDYLSFIIHSFTFAKAISFDFLRKLNKLNAFPPFA